MTHQQENHSCIHVEESVGCLRWTFLAISDMYIFCTQRKVEKLTGQTLFAVLYNWAVRRTVGGMPASSLACLDSRLL